MIKSTKKLILVFLFSFFLNFFWEVLHAPLFTCLECGTNKHIFMIISATFIDSLIVTVVYLIGLQFFKNWFNLDYLHIGSVIFVTVVIAFCIELRAVELGKWSYTSSMPLLFGIGLTPLLQLAITSLITFWVIKKISIPQHRNT